MESGPGEVTLLLGKLAERDPDAAGELMPLVYQELRRIAGYYMRDERASHTLQPTALVNEAYLRLADQTRVDWRNRAHFFGVAARLMRRILVDHARERVAAKRGGRRARIDLDQIEVGLTREGCEELLAVEEALTRLREFDPQQERIVELRYYGGLTVEETAEALRISPRTVKREWAMARAWLQAELAGEAA
ncbi:MAG: sigma-70 family RNA polymerase sigma factor [Bryobacteraceae bacterium]|nr:sigma-70 family RNA polymerase sigma factor [Bryobacteraceae bacterium]